MRTDLGSQEILQRNLKLPTRQRTLLLLIESNDFHKLDQKILNNENLDTLLKHGLIIKKDAFVFIEQIEEEQKLVETKIDTKNYNTLQESETVNRAQEHQSKFFQPVKMQNVMRTEQTEVVEISVLDLYQIKKLMMDTLQKYSGLMSKQLIIAIEHAQTFDELRSYQKKWLTNLFETKICRKQLNQLLQNINQSMQRMDSSS